MIEWSTEWSTEWWDMMSYDMIWVWPFLEINEMKQWLLRWGCDYLRVHVPFAGLTGRDGDGGWWGSAFYALPRWGQGSLALEVDPSRKGSEPTLRRKSWAESPESPESLELWIVFWIVFGSSEVYGIRSGPISWVQFFQGFPRFSLLCLNLLEWNLESACILLALCLKGYFSLGCTLAIQVFAPVSHPQCAWFPTDVVVSMSFKNMLFPCLNMVHGCARHRQDSHDIHSLFGHGRYDRSFDWPLLWSKRLQPVPQYASVPSSNFCDKRW